MQQHSPLLTVMLSAVRQVSKKILRDFYELRFLQSSKRPLNKFVRFTIAKAEEKIFESLQHARPEFGLISHYSDYETKQEANNSWIVNVLDGAENFSRAIPFFSITIAVSQKDKEGKEEFIAGVVYIPALSELYFAEKGSGAWCEFSSEFQAGVSETRLRISEKKIAQPIIFTNDEHFKDPAASIRMIGASSIALSYMASARADKCFLDYNNLSDLAPGIIIAKEAGATIEDDKRLKKIIVGKV